MVANHAVFPRSGHPARHVQAEDVNVDEDTEDSVTAVLIDASLVTVDADGCVADVQDVDVEHGRATCGHVSVWPQRYQKCESG